MYTYLLHKSSQLITNKICHDYDSRIKSVSKGWLTIGYIALDTMQCRCPQWS